MIFVVLGMHKSGTTLLSKILHISGINMGDFDPSVSYDSGNQYERVEFQEINKAILGCGDAHSLTVTTALNPNFEDQATAENIGFLSTSLSERFQNWGFKDPRTCMTFSFWKSNLQEYKVIYVYRSPIEVCHHYLKNIPRYRLFRRLIVGCKALRAWHAYNLLLLGYIRDANDGCYIVQYSDFMSDQQSVVKLSEFVGQPLLDCREKSLYRAESQQSLVVRGCTLVVKWVFQQDTSRIYSELGLEMQQGVKADLLKVAR